MPRRALPQIVPIRMPIAGVLVGDGARKVGVLTLGEASHPCNAKWAKDLDTGVSELLNLSFNILQID